MFSCLPAWLYLNDIFESGVFKRHLSRKSLWSQTPRFNQKLTILNVNKGVHVQIRTCTLQHTVVNQPATCFSFPNFFKLKPKLQARHAQKIPIPRFSITKQLPRELPIFFIIFFFESVIQIGYLFNLAARFKCKGELKLGKLTDTRTYKVSRRPTT